MHKNWNVDVGESSGLEVEEPQTQEVSRMPTIAIDTENNDIGRGDQNAATEFAASISPSRSMSRNNAVISTMKETAGGDEPNNGPIHYRNIIDILRDAPQVELEEEIEEEALLTKEEE